jgi:DNA (cytosine-5)-methyltransferase 1
VSKQLKIVDLFAGVGGLTYGFYNNDNYHVLAANEILPKTAKAYALNHPSVRMYCEDIKDFNIAELNADLGIKKGDIDIVIGGPPCQAYSTVGRRLLDDPRGKLFQEYYRILEELEPKFFLFENVKGLLSMQGGELLKTIMDAFSSLGYKVQYKVLNAADFGAPQIRERVIITGTKLKHGFLYPEPTHYNPEKGVVAGLSPYLRLRDAIGDLPFIGNGGESFEYSSEPQNDFQQRMRKNAPSVLMDQNSPKNSDKLIKIMEHLPDGGSPKDIPEELRPTSGFGNTYARLWWDKPSTTITRNLGTPSSSRCVHPKVPRALTTREGARIQCFPDNYVFYGSRSDKNLQIGEAVPTVLSDALAKFIYSHFSDK